jgi:23S rRNA pseudouridine2605 synthase
MAAGSPPAGERLQKVLARAGFGSRRTCDDLIAQGRVSVNGEVAQLGRRVDPEHDKIAVDGVAGSVRPGLVYYLLNKPPGVVSTADDPEGRPNVIDLVPDSPRVFSVGRLDLETEGLMILPTASPIRPGGSTRPTWSRWRGGRAPVSCGGYARAWSSRTG